MCIIDCLSTIVFILPLHLDYTKVIMLILWWRNFQLEYWRTFQLVSTLNVTIKGRLSIQRPAVLLRWVFGSSPPNRTYTSPRIRLSTNNINLFIVTEFFVTLTTYGNSLSFASHHLFFAGSFPLKIF